MAGPSCWILVGTAVACAAVVRGGTVSKSYQLSEEYTADNFFDKFDFFASTDSSGRHEDDTHGYVEYRAQAEAERMGLISTANGRVYIGPDASSTYNASATGRDSVRITSKAAYHEGLMITTFSHLPTQACGAWPAFWSFGAPWLTRGEIDYFERWNEMESSLMALHTNTTLGGACSLTTTGVGGTVLEDDCGSGGGFTGCAVEDASGAWGAATGATFAMEWTAAAIRLWSWHPGAVPADITRGTPDPASGAWGKPTLLVEQTNCDLGKLLGAQRLVFNIQFCGDTAGNPALWNETCAAKAGGSCASYVADNPSAFAETYFMIEGIQYYEVGVGPASGAATASAVVASLPSASGAAEGLLLARTGPVHASTPGPTATTPPPSTTPPPPPPPSTAKPTFPPAASRRPSASPPAPLPTTLVVAPATDSGGVLELATAAPTRVALAWLTAAAAARASAAGSSSSSSSSSSNSSADAACAGYGCIVVSGCGGGRAAALGGAGGIVLCVLVAGAVVLV